MKYNTKFLGEPILYSYRKNSYRHRGVTDKLQTYRRDELLRHYVRRSSIPKLAEYHYISFSPGAKVQGLANKKHRQDIDDWTRLLYQLSIPYSNNCKEVFVNKSQKMTFELMELKTDGSYYEFIIRESIMDDIVTWECVPDVDTVKQYLKKHPFPKDKLYPEKAFLQDVEKATGYIHLAVEKRTTAEFICELFHALI